MPTDSIHMLKYIIALDYIQLFKRRHLCYAVVRKGVDILPERAEALEPVVNYYAAIGNPAPNDLPMQIDIGFNIVLFAAK
jgi:hypothetical protein